MLLVGLSERRKEEGEGFGLVTGAVSQGAGL